MAHPKDVGYSGFPGINWTTPPSLADRSWIKGRDSREPMPSEGLIRETCGHRSSSSLTKLSPCLHGRTGRPVDLHARWSTPLQASFFVPLISLWSSWHKKSGRPKVDRYYCMVSCPDTDSRANANGRRSQKTKWLVQKNPSATVMCLPSIQRWTLGSDLRSVHHRPSINYDTEKVNCTALMSTLHSAT